LIITIFDPNYPLTSSLSILKEWLIDYLSTDIYNITDEVPQFNEDYIMSKPMIYLQFMSGQVRNVGIGNVISQTQKAQFENMDILCWIYVDNNVGGLSRCRQISDILKTAIRQQGYLLNRAGLTNPRISSLREYPKSSYSPVYGGRMMISFRVLCSYDG
jgi:hypothetical protein